ncbi:TetR family transcriptional regulator [Cryobacterium breve]|uniref:TetR family transcriptional regulator n=1 Tax=Cryobacterium breve TaxID=1259258 RepID=A0ABY7NED9_9MICO|nr:TetR family transcriptional regulator [Cryobacterium breve]
MDFPGKTRPNRRSVQSEATRTEILDAAERLMLERGYIAASVAAIAAEAGVAVQTIYNSVGLKADLLAAVLERGATGPAGLGESAHEHPVSAPRSGSGPRSATDIIRLLVDWCVETNVRTAALRRVVAQAAGVDADVARLEPAPVRAIAAQLQPDGNGVARPPCAAERTERPRGRRGDLGTRPPAGLPIARPRPGLVGRGIPGVACEHAEGDTFLSVPAGRRARIY